MKKGLFTLSIILSICAVRFSVVVAFEAERTHRQLTKEAVKRSVLAKTYYLLYTFGLEEGLDTKVELLGPVQSDLEKREKQGRAAWDKTRTSLEWRLMDGSFFEDVATPRARHHFHDPLRDTGLDNWDAVLSPVIWSVTKGLFREYPGFDFTGGLS